MQHWGTFPTILRLAEKLYCGLMRGRPDPLSRYQGSVSAMQLNAFILQSCKSGWRCIQNSLLFLPFQVITETLNILRNLIADSGKGCNGCLGTGQRYNLES